MIHVNKAVLVVVVAFLGDMRFASAQPAGEPESKSGRFLLGPPPADGPVTVRASFQLHDINEINDEKETFEFTGVLTLRWHDPRSAFDPVAADVNEQIYQGDYQYNEISPGWFPQEVLVNEAGSYEKGGVLLRILPDGTSTLVQTINAIAKAELNMRRFPFDEHRLQAVFEVLGFDCEEVVFEIESTGSSALDATVRIPQWTLKSVSSSIGQRRAPYAGRLGVSSTFVVSVDVSRESFYLVRLVVFPLTIIVLLSFAVFWMDRSSLGDRLSVSFIGILTAVAYQIVMKDLLPHISYVTLIHGFLNISFLTMCATVVINLAVGQLDKRGKRDVGDRVDRRCRWIFPLVYFALILTALAAAFLFF